MVVVFSERAPTVDTSIIRAPGSRVTACLLVSNVEMELGTGGSVANQTP